MVYALSFLHGYEWIEDGDDGDSSRTEDDMIAQRTSVALSKETVYKVIY